MAKYMTDEDWKKFPNFKKSEFKCKCNGKYCNGYPSKIAYSLVEILQKTRDKYNKPITITSGLRCKKHNKAVGGVSTSKHMIGQAADFSFTGMNKNEVIKWLKTQSNYNYAYTNSTNMKGAVHIDTKLVSEPVVSTVSRDMTQNQVKVNAKNLSVRVEPSTSSERIGSAKTNGIYNYYETKKDNKYTWYKISDNQWIANNGKYLTIYEKQEEDSINTAINYEELYNNALSNINELNDKIKSLQVDLNNSNKYVKELETKLSNLQEQNNDLIQNIDNEKNSIKFTYKAYKIYLNENEILEIY